MEVDALINYRDDNGINHTFYPVTKPSNVVGLEQELSSKVDKENGKKLSTEDYTSAEKAKLSSVETKANYYVHPTSSGYKHIPAGGSSGQVLGWAANGTAQWVDNSGGGSYPDATPSAHGLMSAEDKTKLDSVESNANNYIHPTSSGYRHIPTGGSSGQVLGWASNGKAQWVDMAGGGTEYSDATQVTHGLMSANDKVKIDNIASGATRVIVDALLSSSSTNAVQNKAVYNALSDKADESELESMFGRMTIAEAEIAAQTSRIDTITSLEEGSTTGDAELIDIRTEYNGVVALNAGTAVREQITTLISSVDKKTGINFEPVSFTINRNAIHKVENGKHAVYYGSNYNSYRTAIFTPKVGQTYRYSGRINNYSNQYSVICYDADDNVYFYALGASYELDETVAGYEFTVPEGTTALVITSYGGDPVLDKVLSGYDRNAEAIEDLQDELSETSALVSELGIKPAKWESTQQSSASWRNWGVQISYDAGYQFQIEAKNVPSGLTVYAEWHSAYNIDSSSLISSGASIEGDGVYTVTVPYYTGSLYLMYKAYTKSSLNITLNILDSVQANQYLRIKTVDDKVGNHIVSETVAFEEDNTVYQYMIRANVKYEDYYYIRFNTDSSRPFSEYGLQLLENGSYRTSFEDGNVNKWYKIKANNNVSWIGLKMTSSEYLIEKPTYVTLEFADKIYGDTIIHDQEINEIKNSHGLHHYYFVNNWIENTVRDINEQTAVLNGFSFMFFTDLHFNHNEMQSQYLARYVLDRSSIPFILCGGDFTPAYGPNSYLDDTFNQIREYQATIGKDRLFSIRGNHDFTIKESSSSSNGYTCNKATTYNAITKKNEFFNVETVAGEMYYTIDIPSQKLRILMLNSCDGETPGNVAWGVRYTVSSKQITWMLEKLKEKENWKYVIVSHLSADPSVSGYDVSQDEIHKIAKAVNNHSTYGNWDFTDTTNEIVFHLVGHNHTDESHVLDNVLTISTTSDANYNDGGHYRVRGTVYEQAIDVFTIDFDNRTINAYRVGGGNSRSWNY